MARNSMNLFFDTRKNIYIVLTEPQLLLYHIEGLEEDRPSFPY